MTAMRGSNPTATVTDSLAPTRPADAELGGPRPTVRRLGPTTRAGGRRAPRRRWPRRASRPASPASRAQPGERPARRVLAGYRQTAGDELVGQGPVRRCGFARSARTCASIGAAAEGESAHVGPRHIPAAMKEQAGDHRAADRSSGEDLWSCRLAAGPRASTCLATFGRRQRRNSRSLPRGLRVHEHRRAPATSVDERQRRSTV